jgi:hypothetical protein
MSHRDSILDWIIVGGGIHGTYLANALIRHRITSRNDLRIIDPNDEPLADWKRVTANIGMEYLRSPKVHHLDLEPFSLKHFARCSDCEGDYFISPNDRPSLALFNNHADRVIEKNGLQNLYEKGFAAEISLENEYATVATEGETLRSQHVILAVGRGSSVNWPEWALKAGEEGAAICHILEGTFCGNEIPESGEIVVVGGGMSAVQTALSLAGGDRQVTLLSPHSLRQNNYDSDPGWMGPKYLDRFRKIKSFGKRREIINSARNSGTVTQDLKQQLIQRKNRKEISLYVDTVDNCTTLTDNLMLLNLKSGERLAANHIVLATGYSSHRPGGHMIDDLISAFNLNCSGCGYPVTNSSLQWHPRLSVSGALAELEVGPVSGNIIGARMAAEKIIASMRNKHFSLS